jgi:4-amino-4-deoxy-L-arabinose transferase-like glycosyltransferase
MSSENETREEEREENPPANAAAPEDSDEEPEEPEEPAVKAEKADADKKDEEDKEEEGNPLLTPGNPLRARGAITAAIGIVVGFLLMARTGQLRLGVPLGMVAMGIATWGVMDLLGTFDDADDRVSHSTTLTALRMPLLQVLATTLLFALTLIGAQSGLAKQWIWGLLVTGSFLAWVAAVYELGVQLGPWKFDEHGEQRSLLRRQGFWVMAVAGVLYLPFLGSYSLWDPWETHYGEVAREILARDDWVSLWWAQDGWFWSKPILNFWIQSISMAALGTNYMPDQMLHSVAGPAAAHPEWVVRAPVFLMTAVAMYLLYKGVARVFGRRAGLLGAIALATMPDWYFLAHQTMTDMPFVAAMTGAMGLLLIGLHTSDETVVKAYEVKAGAHTFRLTGWHLAFGAILICALPQIVYLITRNVEFMWQGSAPATATAKARDAAHGFRLHFDEFQSGSGGGVCGMPGNEACAPHVPASIPKGLGPNPQGVGPSLLRFFGAFEPALQGLFWALLVGTLLYVNWGERRAKRLYYLAAWFCAALATMAKGPAGFALPMICAFAYVCSKKRWGELLKLELLSGLLIILAVALPWYVAMYVRHGSAFTDRLIFHDMFNRAFNHVHDTNEGDDTSFRFYVWQLGYALFPWTGLAPLGLLYWLRRGDSSDRGRGDVSIFLVMWFIFAFALFSFMGTKFHHYIFPAVPPVAMLVGVALDEMMGSRPLAPQTNRTAYLLTLGGCVTLAVVAITQFLGGSLLGGTTKGVNVALVVASLVAAAAYFLRGFLPRPAHEGAPDRRPAPLDDEGAEEAPPAPEEATKRESHEALMLSGAAVCSALVLGLITRDLAFKEGAESPGAIRLLQLFTYNYRRAWPEHIDFSAVLTAFGIVAVLLALLLSVRAVRHHAAALFAVFAFVWALWGIDIYMVETAPHWGQRELMEAYYANRGSDNEPLVAYQMNWKGENFYTGNHIPAFVSSGANFTSWVKQQREKGVKVMYLVTEHSRTGGMKSEVGAHAYREITDKKLCNKFVLVRAEL